VDGELDIVRHLQIEHHLAECTSCSERHQGLQALREVIAATPLSYSAPAALRERILGSTELAPSTGIASRRHWNPAALFAMAAGILLLIAAAAALAFIQSGRHSLETQLAEQVTSSHVRSLQADVEHLTDVLSSNQHVVKPWFQGRTDYSPPVTDLAQHDFTLIGGRLDYIGERPVAALVYKRREHFINLFVWPAKDQTDRPVRSLGHQSYRISHWDRSGMSFWAISDLNAEEFAEFVRLLQEQ
jgi:anti-sigma factor RsiW